MSTILKYKVENIECLWADLMRFVDSHEAYTGDFILPPWNGSPDSPGEIKWAKFTIYQKCNLFLMPRLSLKVKGHIEKNVLSLRIRFPYLWQLVFSTLILMIFSVRLMAVLSFKYGLILLAVTTLQNLVAFGIFTERKQKFIARIENVIYKT